MQELGDMARTNRIIVKSWWSKGRDDCPVCQVKIWRATRSQNRIVSLFPTTTCAKSVFSVGDLHTSPTAYSSSNSVHNGYIFEIVHYFSTKTAVVLRGDNRGLSVSQLKLYCPW